MRATAPLIGLILSAGALLAPPIAAAGQPGVASLLAPIVWGQTPPSAPTTATSGDTRAKSDALLLQARQQLAVGDVQGAARTSGLAAQLGAVYQLNEDSPAKVQALLRRHAQMVQGSAPGANPQLFQRQYAQFLMDQAQGLMGYGDFQRAKQLIDRAAATNAEYGPLERTPQKMLQQLAMAQVQAAAPKQLQLYDTTLPGAAPVAPAIAQQTQQTPPTSQGPADMQQAKAEALRLISRAQSALDAGDALAAERLAEQARGLNVPDSLFGPDETRPWEILLEVARVKGRNPGNVVQASANQPIGGATYPVQQGVYTPSSDPTRNVQVQGEQSIPSLDPLRPNTTGSSGVPTPAPNGLSQGQAPSFGVSQGEHLYRMGLEQLTAGHREKAIENFREAWQHRDQMDPVTRSQLRDKLTYLQPVQPNPLPNGQTPSPLQELTQQQQIALQALQSKLAGEMRAARQEQKANPVGALNRLQRLRASIQEAELDNSQTKEMLTSVDRQITNVERYIELNRPELELKERNQAVQAAIDADRAKARQVDDQIAEFVDQFNKLIGEERYAEAEHVAKKARELAPNEPAVEVMQWKSRFARQIAGNASRRELSEQGFLAAMNSVQDSALPFDDSQPITFPTRWRELTAERSRQMDNKKRYNEKELLIEKNLTSNVEVKFTNAPLVEVLTTLTDMAGIPLFIDVNGLKMEAVTSDQPVTINISQPIMMKSALNLILDPLGLSYVIEDEVLKVTTAEAKQANVYEEVYSVGDLVIPIPNFTPGYDIGLPSAIREAHQAIGYGGMPRSVSGAPFVVADNQAPAGSGPSFLAQLSRSGMMSGAPRTSQPLGTGPGGAGGAAMADFDTLIELITTTIAPDSWDEVGGTGAVEPFPGNLSLVVSQTQDVHEQIEDLLDQLRELQDLQIAIEVRFITLTDNFFERIGLDFDFDVDDNSLLGNLTPSALFPDDVGPSVSYGLDAFGAPTADLDLQFRQGSFGATTPQFGGFSPSDAATFGFAILSDIEVFFLVEAAQGDQRSNVLQAPKVTLFNGQSASVSDLSQRPFVTSIIPVVGDFSVGQQPVITVLSEGTSLSVQGVISSDRRFVRLTLVPFFSQIGETETFQFTGSQSSDTGTQVQDADGNPTGSNNATNSTQGSTVQLPTFSFTTVSTTVSVPDGGTVLLGGIKRLREGRNERGVPMLAKLPYVSRLFKNVGIGRDAQSLMLMVTPRIIIQSEEEDKLGV